MKREEYLRKPEWLRNTIKPNQSYNEVNDILIKYNLNTVCKAARCPNRKECYNSCTATFMLMGRNCTRNCAFCNVTKRPSSTVRFQRARKHRKSGKRARHKNTL